MHTHGPNDGDGTDNDSVDSGDGGGDGGDGDGDGGDPPVVDHAKDAAKWRAMARKHEAQAKANAEAAKRLKELEDSGKTESEKQAAMIAELKAQTRTATIKALKLQVAADKGLSGELAKFLPDLDDEVDMLAAADELLEATRSTGKADQPTRQPKSNLTNPLDSDDDNAAAKQDALLKSMLGRAV